MTQKPYRLRLPGPTAVSQRVLDASARLVLNHRGPEFAQQLSEVNDMMRPILGTKNDILVFACSGTGVMEAALANVLGQDDRILVLCNGQWGDRFIGIATSLNLNIDVDKIEVPWGEAIPIDALKARLAENEYAAVIAIHNESSTGVVGDLKAIGEAVESTSALLIVDSISGAGGLELRQDEWGVDILVTGSQKALMCPPGLGIASVSDKAWQKVDEERGQIRFYWDFRKAREWAPKGQTAFTPPVTLIASLHEALTMIHEEGLDNVIARHAKLAAALRAGGAAIGLKVFPTAPMISDTVSVLSVPEGIDGVTIVKKMHAEHGSVIAGSRNALRGKIIRIGTMGIVTGDDIVTDLKHLEATLADLGLDFESGAGVAAVEHALN